MKKNILFALLAAFVFTLASCSSGKREARRAAKEHLRMSVDYPDQLKVGHVSEPDSVFGLYYLSDKDKELIYGYMRQVTDTIMKRTGNMERWNPNDVYVANLAERQMRASAELRNSLLYAQKKEAFSGWKVRVPYSAFNHQGEPYRAVRWYYFDKKGKQVIRFIDFPLP